MKQVLLFSLFIISFHASKAQDTVYVDKAQRRTSRDKAAFYKISFREGSLYRCETYALGGNLMSLLYYSDKDLTTLEGPARYFYANGTIDSEGPYKNNLRNGSWKFYSQTGKQTGFIFFKDNKVATADYLERYGHMMDDNNDALPSFKGGKDALVEYIRQTLNPIQKLAKEKIKGTVKVGFVVSETGKITDVHIVSGINDQVNQQAIKMINGMPDWHPGMQYDKPVKVPLIIPIVF